MCPPPRRAKGPCCSRVNREPHSPGGGAEPGSQRVSPAPPACASLAAGSLVLSLPSRLSQGTKGKFVLGRRDLGQRWRRKDQTAPAHSQVCLPQDEPKGRPVGPAIRKVQGCRGGGGADPPVGVSSTSAHSPPLSRAAGWPAAAGKSRGCWRAATSLPAAFLPPEPQLSTKKCHKPQPFLSRTPTSSKAPLSSPADCK